MIDKPAIVTTEHRGVFYGTVEVLDHDKKQVTLANCRNVIRWEGPDGFLRLAKDGPLNEDRIGSLAPRVVLYDLTSVSEIGPEAEEKWKAL